MRETRLGRLQSPEEIEPRVNWKAFPNNAQRVIAGVLEELQTPSLDRPPEETSRVYQGVVDTLEHLSHLPSPYDRWSNRQISSLLQVYSKTASSQGKQTLASELRILSSTVATLTKPRKKTR